MQTLEEVSEYLNGMKYAIVHSTRGIGVDLGISRYKAYRHFIAVRKRDDPLIPAHGSADHWVEDWANALDDFKDDSLDFVFAWGDVPRPDDAELFRVLKVGGHFALALPTGEIQVWRRRAAFSESNGLTGFEVIHPRPVVVTPAAMGKTHRQKTACVVRFGAIGDNLQAGCILPELKRMGYHVTYMCEPTGETIMREDPHIDAFLVQDPDQVPNHELPLYFDYWRPKFDKFINLCESIEGTLICLPGRAKFDFPKEVRHELCNHNYLEFLTRLAELPFHAEHKFYASESEVLTAASFHYDIERKANKDWVMGMRHIKPYVVMWALSGSGIHKFYPHQDAVIARILMEIPHAQIILSGNAECKVLEYGWENEPRVHCTSGEMGIRDTLALAQMCDLVVGPETGVLNSVAFESMAKIVFLSHSTHENLTKHWVNTEALSSESTPCYPCHQLHQDRTHCPCDPESGAALCQQSIEAATVWAAVQRAFTASGTVKQLLEAA